MSLDYALREGQANADLDAEGINDQEMFGFLLYMAVTKVGDLKPANRQRFLTRVSEYLTTQYGEEDALQTYSLIVKYTLFLEGMTTNISTESDDKWKNHLYALTQSRAANLRVKHREKYVWLEEEQQDD
jgi:hypothetical protein